MRTLPPTLREKLESGITTMAQAWRITRRDGVTLGFTDHDRPLTFGGTTFVPATALERTETTSEVGLNATSAEMMGAITSEALIKDDLLSGLYEAARVEMWSVDWTAPEDRILLRQGTIGEVRLDHFAGAETFVAEIRDAKAALATERGRVFTRTCTAQLGDSQCGVDLTSSSFQTTTTLLEREGPWLKLPPLSVFAANHFEGGTIKGLDAKTYAIKTDETNGVNRWIELWDTPHVLSIGEEVTLTAGCDKTFATCRDRFANKLNFRGFPHMPGDDLALRYASASDGPFDGSSLINS
jgi:uncharacterized phage protein (TIGR02218 family)